MPGSGCDEPRHQLHQRGLARAVAPDERDPLARLDRERDAREQRVAAEAQARGRRGSGSEARPCAERLSPAARGQDALAARARQVLDGTTEGGRWPRRFRPTRTFFAEDEPRLRLKIHSALARPLPGLHGRRAAALTRLEPSLALRPRRAGRATAPPACALLQLPEGFSYQSFGWAGDPMDNGDPTPMAHDGMAVVRARLVGGQPEITLIRNHEFDVAEQVGLINADRDLRRRRRHLRRPDRQALRRQHHARHARRPLGLGGAGARRHAQQLRRRPDALGHLADLRGGQDRPHRVGGQPHGYVFEVSDDPAKTSGKPIVAMGRFDHEAVAVDPRDRRGLPDRGRPQPGRLLQVRADATPPTEPGALEQGGTLYMAKVAGTDGADLLDPRDGRQLPDRVGRDRGSRPGAAALHRGAASPTATPPPAPSSRAARRAACACRAARAAATPPADRLIYIVDTSTGIGVDEDSGAETAGFGEGSVWTFDPATDTLTCLFQSGNALAGNNFDNITVSPRGGVLLCEDGGGVDDVFGPGERLMGLTPAGDTYIFAKNNVMLTAGRDPGRRQVARVHRGGRLPRHRVGRRHLRPDAAARCSSTSRRRASPSRTGPWEANARGPKPTRGLPAREPARLPSRGPRRPADDADEPADPRAPRRRR